MRQTIRSATNLRPMRPVRATTPMAARAVAGVDGPRPPRRRSGVAGLTIAAAISLGAAFAATLPARVPGSTVAAAPLDVCATPRTPPPVAAATAARLTAAFRSIDADAYVPGMGAAVLFPDGSAWTSGRGAASVEPSSPVTSETGFAYASAGKIAIAALVLRDVERGEYRLTDRVADLLPGAPIDPRATVAQLLGHRAGLGDYLTNAATGAAISADRDAELDPNDFVANAGTPRSPGRFDYSNTGYLFAAALLEREGTPWLRRLEDEIFEPFSLCSISAPGVEQSPVVLARGYEARGGGWEPVAGTSASSGRAILSAAGPAGGLAGTPLDLARLGAAVMGEGLLSARTRSIAFPDRAGGYGLGFARYLIAGRAVYGHGGRLEGARSAVRYDPISGITVAITWNRADPDPDAAAAALLAAALR